MSKKRRAAIGATAVATAVASLLVAAPAANADSSGRNGGIVVTARGSGGHVTNTYATISSLAPFTSFYGHYRVFGPDYSSNSPTQQWSGQLIWNVQVHRDYANGQQHCAEAWEQQSDGSHKLLGRPCVQNPV